MTPFSSRLRMSPTRPYPLRSCFTALSLLSHAVCLSRKSDIVTCNHKSRVLEHFRFVKWGCSQHASSAHAALEASSCLSWPTSHVRIEIDLGIGMQATSFEAEGQLNLFHK